MAPKLKVRWTSGMEDQLVELWQSHECLYNVSSKCYHNRNDKDKSWQEIATAMELSVEEVRARATSLRTQYSKLLKHKPSGSGEKDLTSKKKWMLKSMFFLKTHVTQRATETSLHVSVKDSLAAEDPTSDAEDDVSEVSELSEDVPPELSASASQSRPSTPLHAHTPEPPNMAQKRKKFISADSIELEKVRILQQMSTDFQANRSRPVADGDTTFGVQVTAELRLITNPVMKSRAKLQIMTALYEAQQSVRNSDEMPSSPFLRPPSTVQMPRPQPMYHAPTMHTHVPMHHVPLPSQTYTQTQALPQYQSPPSQTSFQRMLEN